jgi:CRISPR-associated endonuclease/helicase Cas3
LETARLIILGDGAWPSVWSKVYDRAILLRSFLALRSRTTLILPTDISPLVEETYRPDDKPPASLSATDAETWVESHRALRQELANERALGTLARIAAPTFPDGIAGVTPVALSDADHHPATRLTPFTVEMICVAAGNTPGMYRGPATGREIAAEETPEWELTKRLLGQSLRVQGGWAERLWHALPQPSGWQRSGMLSHMRLAALDANGRLAAASVPLWLDTELGLVLGNSR